MSGTASVSDASWYASIGPPAAISPMIGRAWELPGIVCGVSSDARPSLRAAVGVSRIARDWDVPSADTPRAR